MVTVEGEITVLLVDDNPDVADVTRMHLRRQSDAFDIVVEHGAAKAMGALEDDVDCVVSDYEMPNSTGLDLLRDVREYDEMIPFILFTGRGSEEIASEAISAGVTDYFQKETGTEQYAVLANRIENAVGHRRSMAEAAESEARYRSLVESSPHAILVHDGREIRYVNERLVELIGIEDKSSIYGNDPLSFVHPEDREAIRTRMQRVFEDGDRQDWFEFRLVVDDEILHVESRATQVQYEGELASQVVLRDVAERNRRERRLKALHEATRRLLTAEDRDAVGAITIDVLTNVFEESAAAVWEYDEDANDLRPLAMTEKAKQIATVGDGDRTEDPLPDSTVEMETFEAGEPRVVEEYAERDDAVTDALESVFLYPLKDHGLLAIASPEPRTIETAERELIGILARSIVAALKRLDDAAE